MEDLLRLMLLLKDKKEDTITQEAEVMDTATTEEATVVDTAEEVDLVVDVILKIHLK